MYISRVVILFFYISKFIFLTLFDTFMKIFFLCLLFFYRIYSI
ncbi:hypothetical protein HMPREF1154_1013 [Capnocytophaga sp. CM59]|nr:hypothetical protein HMPREF1154_1013 [Capnocytophaga sp. CM59]